MAYAPGKMAAVRNISEAELRYILETFQIDIGVINSRDQVVLSGETQAMEEAIAYLKSKAINPLILPISIASHSRVMRKVQPQFASALDAFTFRDARIPIISVYEAQRLTDGFAIKAAFVEQMTHTLDFPRMLSAARQSGADTFVEFGPKGPSRDGVLTGNIHALDSSLIAFNVRDLSTIRDNPFPF